VVEEIDSRAALKQLVNYTIIGASARLGRESKKILLQVPRLVPLFSAQVFRGSIS